ncbi:hypothetical protein [Undibacterium sp. WLX3042]|uniref:hypothetical protein n=1 Tax=Undibacterium sp. WLX3042 TaxID=3412686 RepID=UPI003C2CC0E3
MGFFLWFLIHAVSFCGDRRFFLGGIEIRSRESEKLISDYPRNFWGGAFEREVFLRAELDVYKHLRGDVELISELAVVAGHEDQAFK